MFRDFIEVLGFFMMMFLLAIFLVVFMFMLFFGVCGLFDKSVCDVFVDDSLVYSGRCHFIDIDSIGENGNTKYLCIYDDIFHIKPIEKYVSNNVIVKGGN